MTATNINLHHVVKIDIGALERGPRGISFRRLVISDADGRRTEIIAFSGAWH